jgi:hypothetical protein
MRRADNLTILMCWLSWNLWTSTSWKPQGLSRDYCTILMGSVASPLTVTTEFWQYLHSALPGISEISITRYQINVTLEARWSHLNKKVVTLCIVDFADLAKGITNDALAFEWGEKLCSEWIKNQHAGFSLSVTAFEANLLHFDFKRGKLNF